MACSAAARWRKSSRLPLSAHWRSSRTRTTGWCCRHRGQQTDHGGEEQEALGVGVGGLRRREVRDSAGQGRHQPGQFRPVFLDVGEELVLGSVGDVVPEGLGEELVGGGEVLLAVAEEHTGPGVEGGPGRLGHERGLAQTGLARDEQDLAPFAPGDTLGGVGHGLHLGLASDDTDGGAHGQTTGQWDGGCRCRPRRVAPTAPRRSRPGRAGPSGSAPRASGTRGGCADRPCARTTSVARTCPLSQVAQSRAASTTGSPK